MNQSTLEKFILELRASDNSRLKGIYQENLRYCVQNLIKYCYCSQQDAEDVYTDAVLNLREKILGGKVAGLPNVRGYLYSTCKRMVFVKLEKEKRIHKATAVLYDSQHELDLPFDNEENGHEYREEISRITIESMSKLSDKCQALLKAFYFDKLSFVAIAKKFNMASEGVAKVSKSRCFQHLLKTIENQMKR